MKPALLRILSGALLLALCVTALVPGAAYAQEGGDPPDPVDTSIIEEPAEPQEPAASESAEVADEAEPAAEAEAPPEQAAEPEADEPQADEPAEPDDGLLADVPEGTEVVVLGEDGEPLPLASQEAADAIIIGDPMWCPAGVTPGAPSCSPSFPDLGGGNIATSLLEWLKQNPQSVNGVIWIESTYNSITPVVFDGSELTSMATKTLVIQGGWQGVLVGNGKVIKQDDPSVINHTLNITNWANDVTLNDILLTGVNTDQQVLHVNTTGKVTLNRVQVNNNTGTGNGAELYSSTKDVVVNSSSFNDNGGTGLVVQIEGLISLRNVDAIDNGNHGATLNNNFPGATKGVTLAGTNVFSGNTFSGLVIFSHGAITLNNLIAISNGFDGAEIDNAAGAAQPVKLTGSSQFRYNDNHGLSINSKGQVTLSNITASHNIEVGATVNNSLAATDLGVTFSGVNTFNANGFRGLDVLSNGVIAVSNLTASYNVLSDGAWLRHLGAGTARAVTLSGAVNLIDNGGTGLKVESKGTISIANLTASLNDGSGAVLSNSVLAPSPQAVNITGLALFEGNGADGLLVLSKGAITVRNAAARENTGHGIYLKNNESGSTGAVTMQALAPQANELPSFFFNGQNGLQVESNGTVTIQGGNFVSNGQSDPNSGLLITNTGGVGNVTLSGLPAGLCYQADNNSLFGIEIASSGAVSLGRVCASDNDAGGVSINNSGVAIPKAVTLAGGEFNNNNNTGLRILSAGVITVSNIVSLGNDNKGVELDNTFAGSPQAVRMNGTNEASYNGSQGLVVTSMGAITANNLSAFGNGALLADNTSVGISLKNNYNPASQQAVSLTGYVHADGNWADGLVVESYGAITVNNVTAGGNGRGPDDVDLNQGWGAVLDNNHGDNVKPAPVTLNGTNNLGFNWSGGLYVESLDVIKANNLSASVNGAPTKPASGATLNNNLAATPKAVTLTGYGTFDDNTSFGLGVNSKGAVSLAKLTAWYNTGGGGVVIDNTDPGAVGGVTLSGENSFGYNAGDGLSIMSHGAIRIDKLYSVENDGKGAYLQNSGAGAANTAAVTITGSAILYSNDMSGLHVVSNRAITVANLTASGNEIFGVWLDNKTSGSPDAAHNVTLTGSSNFIDNKNMGLGITTYGAVITSNLTAADNQHVGVIIDNCAWNSSTKECEAELARPVTVNGSNSFLGNGWNGLEVYSMGAITANNMTAQGNGYGPGCPADSGCGFGVILNNATGLTPPAPVTLNGSHWFQSNTGYGLDVKSRGLVRTNNLTAKFNSLGGVYMNNQFTEAKGGVVMTGKNWFEWNDQVGLTVLSHGAITLSNLNAYYNGFGVSIESQSLTSAQVPVTLTGSNNFVGNIGFGTGRGLEIDTDSHINVSNLVAKDNQGHGVDLNNSSLWNLSTDSNITMTGVNHFLNNGGNGLVFNSVGNVVLNRVTADDNMNAGVFGNAWGGNAPANITISCSTMAHNSTGFDLASFGGLITLKDTFALGMGNSSVDEFFFAGDVVRQRGNC